jgi:hypothetical protein
MHFVQAFPAGDGQPYHNCNPIAYESELAL